MSIFVIIEATKAKISPIFADFCLYLLVLYLNHCDISNILTNTPNSQFIPIVLTF